MHTDVLTLTGADDVEQQLHLVGLESVRMQKPSPSLNLSDTFFMKAVS